MSSIRITTAHARRFHRRATLLDAPAPDIASALAHLGYVQIDPINVCGRMQDLILRNRVADYREGGLTRHLHGEATTLRPDERTAFEQHLPSAASGILVALPLDAWPHVAAVARERGARKDAWSGRLHGEERAVAEEVLRAIELRGPLSAEDFDDDRRAKAVWGAATLVKATMQKLFFHGAC